MSLVPILELLARSNLALHLDVAEFVAIHILVYRPETEYTLEVIIVHPEYTVIFIAKEINLTSDLIGPEWRFV